MRSFTSTFAALTFACLVSSTLAADRDWVHTKWNGEDAWSSRNGDQEAIVSVDRSRVIYLGSADGTKNFLSAPTKAVAPTAQDPAPNWGGHRFWLGRQTLWGWPPPVEWEHAGATSAEVHNGVLTLKEPHNDPAYPPLERDYAWEGDRLRCTGRWGASKRVYYSMQVVAVVNPVTVEANLREWELVPRGLVHVQWDKPDGTKPIDSPAVKILGDHAEIHSGVDMIKLGFYPQTLKLARTGGTLLVSPGPVHGIAVEPPDFGYLTQVWVGFAKNGDFSELEQISPYVLPADDGWCGATIYLQAQISR